MTATSRSVGRYRPEIGLNVGVAGLIAIFKVLARDGIASPRPEPSSDPGPARIGMSSCAARGCHGVYLRDLLIREPSMNEGWDRRAQRFLAVQVIIRAMKAGGLTFASEEVPDHPGR